MVAHHLSGSGRPAGLFLHGTPGPLLPLDLDHLHRHRVGLRPRKRRRVASGLEHHQQCDGQPDQHHQVAVDAPQRLAAPLRPEHGPRRPRSGQQLYLRPQLPQRGGAHAARRARADRPRQRGADARKPARLRGRRARQPRLRTFPLDPPLLQLPGPEPDRSAAHRQQRPCSK